MQEPEVRIRNRHYSYTKSYKSINTGIHELFNLVPSVADRIYPQIKLVPDNVDDTELIRAIFANCYEMIMKDFPTVYDEAFPATLALSITADRFYIRLKDKTALMWDYDSEALRNGDEVLIHLTIQFTESGNRLLSNKLTEIINTLKEHGYTYIDDKELRERRSPRFRTNRDIQSSNNDKDFNQFSISERDEN